MKINNYPKIYFGPMSKNIVDTLLKLSDIYPIGFIPSRRQVEHDRGYVNNWSSIEFCSYVKEKSPTTVVCRDHGGRLQGGQPDDGVESVINDCEAGFDIIHIDPWKKYVSIEEVAHETAKNIKLCLKHNKKMKFEVGTEEAIHRYSAEELDKFLSLLKVELGEDFSSILYAVVQFGTSIVGTKNTGVFDLQRAKRMLDVCNKFDLLSKEHNGDYLSSKEIKSRFNLGLDAINIAPEFGVFETSCLMESLASNLKMQHLEEFSNICYDGKKWVKWLPDIKQYKDHKMISFVINRVSGHYHFSNPAVLKWKAEDPEIDKNIKNSLYNKLAALLFDCYI